mgnify:CR=1 FL=1
MNQYVLESIFLVFAFINACITLFFLWKAKQQRRLKRAIVGAVGGIGTAIGIGISGMAVVLISQFFVQSAVEMGLLVVFMVASCVVPVTTWMAQKA